MFPGGTGMPSSPWKSSSPMPPSGFRGPYEDYIWSRCRGRAPTDEIEGIIGQVYARQMLLQGVIVFIILMGGGIVLLHELRWATILEHEVAVKTEHLRHYAAQLEQSESRYRSLVESAEDLIFTLNEDGVIKTVNQYMCELFGVDRDSLLEKNLHAFLPPPPPPPPPPEEQAEKPARTGAVRQPDGKGKEGRNSGAGAEQ